MSVSAITSTNAAADPADLLPEASRVPQKTLGQQEFFKLIAVQFASQDPLKPMDDTSFIAQLANFSALENSAQLASDFGRFATQQGISGAQGLLGRTVTLKVGDDPEVVGMVTAVRTDGGTPSLAVNGAYYDVSSVRRVELTSNPATAD